MLTYYISIVYVSIIEMFLPNYKYVLMTNVLTFNIY
jgi:hypothetical protein